EICRGGLEPPGDRVESLGERRVVTGEQEEEAVADVVERKRSELPKTKDVGVEDRAPEIVHLQLALESRLVGQRGGIDRLNSGQVLAIGGQLREDCLAAA